MSPVTLHLREMDQFDPDARAADPGGGAGWVWDGFLARADLAVLTGLWKTGKTTLLAGLLHALGGGGAFLGRACAAGRAVVVSEESPAHWAERRRAIPVGRHVRLAVRPFLARPAPADWDGLVGALEAGRAADPFDLFVVDPLATFLPGRSESDAGALLDFLTPLRRLATAGVAVLVLHHPRREKSAEGSLARGGGALLGYADALLELHHVNRGRTGTRRRLTARSRRPGAAAEVVYEWAPGTADFRVVADDPAAWFQENWATLKAVLDDRPAPATHQDLLAAWPLDPPPPSRTILYDWLRRAVAAKLVSRLGDGTKYSPFRFVLPDRLRAAAGRLPDLGPILPPGW